MPPISMKPLTLLLLAPTALTAAWVGSALANPLAAPSTLPLGSATTAPPSMQAPEAPRAWRMPAQTQAAPATAPDTAPLQSAPAQSIPTLQPHKAAVALVATDVETVTLINANDARYKGLDLPRLKQNLSSRFATLTLDESDRAELKLDTQAFQYLLAPVATAQPDANSEFSRPFTHAPRVKMSQALPQAEQRVMGLTGSGGLAPDLTARSSGLATRVMNPELWCSTYQQNLPRLSRVLIEASHLTPGMAFVLKGTCLGQAPGKVEVRFREANGQVVEARVLDWAADKVFVELPDITGVAPGMVEITAITADRRMTQAISFPFWPNWVLVDLPWQRLKVDKCYSFEAKPYVRARCIAGPKDVKSPGYEVPSALFGVGGVPMHSVPIWTTRYSEKVLTEDHVGWDSYSLNLPPWAHLQSWQASGHRLPNGPRTKVLRHEWDPNTQRISSKWQLVATGHWGFLEYWLYNLKAWVPVGLRLD
jgi:hypothetical protein